MSQDARSLAWWIREHGGLLEWSNDQLGWCWVKCRDTHCAPTTADRETVEAELALLPPASIRVKRMGEHNLPVPARATPGAAGLDLRNAGPRVVVPCAWEVHSGGEGTSRWIGKEHVPGRCVPIRIPTGFAFEIPVGFEGQVRGRSGLAFKHGVGVVQDGTIDADYRGEVAVPLINHGTEDFVIEHGDRCAQLVIAPVAMADCELAEELTETARGVGGFGSTGK